MHLSSGHKAVDAACAVAVMTGVSGFLCSAGSMIVKVSASKLERGNSAMESSWHRWSPSHTPRTSVSLQSRACTKPYRYSLLTGQTFEAFLPFDYSRDSFPKCALRVQAFREGGGYETPEAAAKIPFPAPKTFEDGSSAAVFTAYLISRNLEGVSSHPIPGTAPYRLPDEPKSFTMWPTAPRLNRTL